VLSRHGVKVILASHNAVGIDGVEDLGPLRGYYDYFCCVKQIRSLVKKYKPDLIHAHGATHYGVTAAFIKEVPYVLALWGSDIMLAPVAGPFPKRLFYRAIIRFSTRRASLCHSSSMHVCQKAAEISRQPITKFKAWFWGVIPDNLWMLPSEAVTLKMQNEFSIGEKVVLCGRGMRSIYRPETVASVIKEFTKKQKDKKFQFVVLRGFAEDSDVENFLRQLQGYENSFIFIDRLLNEDELSFIYNRSIAHISIPVSDSLGGGVIEPAMAGSFPVLSDIPGNTWFVNKHFGCIVGTTSNQLIDVLRVVNTLLEIFDRSAISDNELEKLRSEFCADTIAYKMIQMYENIRA